MKKTFATFKTVVRTAGDETDITISTRAIDRDGDVIEPSGGDFSNYLKNPVVLFGHDHHSIPIARTRSLSVDANGIRATFNWLKNDPQADRVRNAFDQGVLNAASIGFLPREWEEIRDSYGRRYTNWELLEFSIVPVPSNPEAIRTLKSLGLSAGASGQKRIDNQPAADRLDGLLTELKAWRRKSGRVLSAANEQSIRDAIASLEAVLAHLDADDDKGFLTFDDLGDEIPDELVAETFARVLPEVLRSEVTSAIHRLTGRLD